MKKPVHPVAAKKAAHHIQKKKTIHVENKGETMTVSSAPAASPETPAKRELTKAEAEEVLDRLHYCKKHGTKMKSDEHGAWHCETDDKEQAAAEEAEAKEAWAVFSKK